MCFHFGGKKKLQVGLLNVDGYYNYLLTFIDKAVDDGFIKPSQRHIFVSAPNAKELVQKLEVGTHQNIALLLSWDSDEDNEDKNFELGNRFLFFDFPQAYEPVSDGVIAKSRWEVEKKVQQPQQVVFCSNTSMQTEIAL